MSERELNFGADRADAKYASGEASDGHFKIVEDTNGDTILLEWDSDAGQFVSRGPIELSGNDVTGVGALDAASISTGEGTVETVDDTNDNSIPNVGWAENNMGGSGVTPSELITMKDSPAPYYDPDALNGQGAWVSYMKAGVTGNYPQVIRAIAIPPNRVMEWTGMFDTLATDVDLHMGMEARPSRNEPRAIQLKSQGGDVIFRTRVDNTNNDTTITSQKNWEGVIHDFRMEWVGGTRVTLYVDGDEVVEHTDLIPDGSMVIYIEAVHNSDTLTEDSTVYATNDIMGPGTYLDPVDDADHHWKLDEGSGSTAGDSAGSTDLSINGASWVSDSGYVGGYGLSGDGTDDSLYTDTSAFNGYPVTLLTTVKTTTASTSGLYAIDYNNSSIRFNVLDTGELGFNVSGDTSLTGSTAVNDGNKHRVAATYDGSTAAIWVDGEKDAEASKAFDSPTDSDIRIMGEKADYANLAGEIDNPAVVPYAWGGSAISDDYDNQPWS